MVEQRFKAPSAFFLLEPAELKNQQTDNRFKQIWLGTEQALFFFNIFFFYLRWNATNIRLYGLMDPFFQGFCLTESTCFHKWLIMIKKWILATVREREKEKDSYKQVVKGPH